MRFRIHAAGVASFIRLSVLHNTVPFFISRHFIFQKILDLSPIIQYTEIDYHTDNVISH